MITRPLPHQNNLQKIGYKLFSCLTSREREEVDKTLISAYGKTQ
ncbi:Fourth ORF in transposon ISC1225 [Saccharolobus solfataricus P2]|uniref:Fourth ORF in transposon ISC1225 n=1 Tax=Saccharolobus solfataricus (strain ATCC 35092 / DSM 1617 / JCM 11322 / P2) TaxID=273057 RepID=Q97ZP4_SACS2|nr:Fourth ORF in transposon ISC1225 [Saccharolobus solfataricus P2]